MSSIQEIAEEIANELDPGHGEWRHSKIANGVLRAIGKGREQYERISFELVLAATELMTRPGPQSEEAMKEVIGRWRRGEAGSKVSAVWLVFQWRDGVAEFQGVFTSEEKAILACRTENHCVCPAALDDELKQEGGTWPGAWYPHLEPRPKVAGI